MEEQKKTWHIETNTMQYQITRNINMINNNQLGFPITSNQNKFILSSCSEMRSLWQSKQETELGNAFMCCLRFFFFLHFRHTSLQQKG